MSNARVVLKAGGKLQICIDFKDLYKACPNDCFPLPSIKQLVDSTLEHKLLNFVYAYLGYYQVLLYLEDVEKTSFSNIHLKLLSFVIAWKKGLHHFSTFEMNQLSVTTIPLRLCTSLRVLRVAFS